MGSVVYTIINISTDSSKSIIKARYHVVSVYMNNTKKTKVRKGLSRLGLGKVAYLLQRKR